MRRALGALLGALAFVAAACGDSGGAPGAGEPPEETSPRDPDVVVSVSTDGPNWPERMFEMRTDGTVFVDSQNGAGTARYRLTDEGIQTVRDLIAELSPDDDYGDIGWTDLSNTNVYVNLGGQPFEANVYGLEWHRSDPEDLSDELSSGQIEARDRLFEIQSTLWELDEQVDLVAEPRAPHTETLELILLGLEGDPGLYGRVEGDPLRDAVEWPLETPLTELPLGFVDGSLCVVLTGDDATAVSELIDAPGEQERPWTTGAEPGAGSPTAVRLHARGVPPGEGSCDLDAEADWLQLGPLSYVVPVDPVDWEGEMEADSFERADPLALYAAASIVMSHIADRTADLSDEELEQSWEEGQLQLPTLSTYYEYEAIEAQVGGARHIDLEARVSDTSSNPQNLPESWRARVDLAEEVLTTVEID